MIDDICPTCGYIHVDINEGLDCIECGKKMCIKCAEGCPVCWEMVCDDCWFDHQDNIFPTGTLLEI